jgi:hypothetical protein
MEKALEQLKVISEEDYAKVKNLANIVRPLRSVLFKTPDDYGMTGWRNIYFQSDDGIPLEGWYIPAKGGNSNKLVIFNHALPMCRAGFPGHLGEPWSMYDAVEIDFVIQQKHLSDAGYNVLAYDIRNHGTSSAANGGISGIGRWEWCDCVGVKKYVDSHPALSKMTVGLYSQCMERQLAVRGHLQAARSVRERSVHVQSDGCFHGGDLLSHFGAPRHQPISGTHRSRVAQDGRFRGR